MVNVVELLTSVSPSTLLTGINTILIIGTIGLGISTYVFQKRTSLRESLEQLDSLWLEHRSEYIGVFLHEFSYFPLLKNSAVLKFYVREPTPQEKANVGMIKNAARTLDEVHDMSPEDLESFGRVKEAWADASGIYIKTKTVNSVKCRQLAEEIQLRLEIEYLDEGKIPR